jgi:HlyD family secretion protein
MKKKLFITGIILVILIALVLIFKPFGNKTAEYTFETVKVEKGKIANVVTATGTIEAVTSVDIGTQVSGIIDKIYVDFNDNVKQGDLLAVIDKKQLQAQLDQSMATLDQAKAQLNFQEATFNRMKALFEKKLIAQSDYDQAFYNYENARASLKNATSSYERNRVNLNYSEIYSPIDGVVLNRAIEEGQTVAASFNTPTLFTIVNDLTQMEVETSVDEADIGKVQKDQRVEFTVDAYPERIFEGAVSEVRLQPTTTNNVVTYSVILTAPNPEKKLMPGMTASATIYVQEKDSALMLTGKATRFRPDMAYLQEQLNKAGKYMVGDSAARPAGLPQGVPAQMPLGGNMGAGMTDFSGGFSGGLPDGSKMVWIRDDKGGIRPNPIKTGIDNGTQVEVISGLKEGDEVIVSMSNGSEEENADQNNMRGPFPFGG